ncbi:MAG: S8 family serine peptidase [Candidatus Heimdallarchaeota archaeon]|nr:S8 family serine peptidase [Candidatus Heimdallarchaeota archaeon]
MYNYQTNNTRFTSNKTITYFMIASLVLTGIFVVAPVIFERNETQNNISPILFNYMMEYEGQSIDVLISTNSYDYSEIVDTITEIGGTVSFEYQFAKGLAAKLPKSGIFVISQLEGVVKVALDEQITPNSFSREAMADLDAEIASSAFKLDTSEFEVLDLSTAEVEALIADMGPNNYANALSMGALSLWDQGILGQGSLSVVIDTGIYADHSMFDPGQVIGGIDLSTDVGTPFEGPFSVNNHYHGTHVAGTIAGRGAYLFPTAGVLVQSMLANGFDVPEYDDSNSIVTLFGMAPLSDLYAIKVFDHTGGSASNSIIIAGIEHAIALHLSGTDVDTINMSLGGGSGYEGRDLESQAVDRATAEGITVVVSAGNDGPASQTIGTPSGAQTAITVGAALTPEHTRVFWDFNFGFVGAGDLLFTPTENQMVYFSSRGPTSDGRSKPTASTVGVFVLSSMTGDPGALGFLSGTSMAAPNMAGIINLLNTVGEGIGASPYDYKQAVVEGSTMMTGYPDWAQGAGFTSAEDSMAALMADDDLGEDHPMLNDDDDDEDKIESEDSVKPFGTELNYDDDHDGDDDASTATFTLELADMTPGHVQDWWFEADDDLQEVRLDFSNVDLGVDPVLFNSFEAHLMSSMRTTDSGYHFYSTNVWGDATLIASDLSSTASGAVFGVNTENLPLMNGYMRLSIENDWTSYDDLSGTVTVTLTFGDDPDADEEYEGELANHESYGFFGVGFGTTGVLIELSWENDWSKYPTSDMDMIVAWFDTDGNLFYEFGGATFSSPEMVKIEATNIDTVFVLVDGFETYGMLEEWQIQIWYLN